MADDNQRSALRKQYELIATTHPAVGDAVARRDPRAYMEALNDYRLGKLQAQIARCLANEFYGPRLRECGLEGAADLTSMDQFRRLPILMDKAAHRESQRLSSEKYGHPFGVHIGADLRDVIHIAGTSGTTGLPTFYLFTRKDLDITAQVFGRVWEHAGMRRGESVLHLFGLSIWLGGMTLMQTMEAYGARPIPLGAEAGVTKALQYIAMCRPRVLCGTPSYFGYLLERAESVLGREARTLGIEVLIGGGEMAFSIPATRQQLSSGFGAKVVDFSGGAWHNGAAECGGPVHRGLHYLAEDHCFRYDLVDPETREPLPLVDGMAGEAIHTALAYEAGPALRYASGDMLKLHVGECPHCGEFGARFSYVGRVDDLLNIAGNKVYPAAFQEIVREFVPRVSGHMEIVLDRPPPKVASPVHLTVEIGEGGKAADARDLGKMIEDRMHLALKVRAVVTVVDFGALTRSVLKTKLIRVTG